MKPGWYWAKWVTTSAAPTEREIVKVEMRNGSLCVWSSGSEVDDLVSDWTDYVPVAPESAVAELVELVSDVLGPIAIFADRYRRDYECGESNHPTHQDMIDRAKALIAKYAPAPRAEEVL